MYRVRLNKMYISYGCIKVKVISLVFHTFQRIHITLEIMKMLLVKNEDSDVVSQYKIPNIKRLFSVIFFPPVMSPY